MFHCQKRRTIAHYWMKWNRWSFYFLWPIKPYWYCTHLRHVLITTFTWRLSQKEFLEAMMAPRLGKITLTWVWAEEIETLRLRLSYKGPQNRSLGYWNSVTAQRESRLPVGWGDGRRMWNSNEVVIFGLGCNRKGSKVDMLFFYCQFRTDVQKYLPYIPHRIG